MQNWYVLNTKPNLENFVSDQLSVRGIEVYLPKWQPRGRRTALAPRPFFASYLFARSDCDLIGISMLRYTPGVRCLVMCGDEPALLSQAEIDEIRMRIHQKENRILDSEGNSLATGNRVVIVGGPFQGYEALFDRASKSDDRARVLINFLHKHTPCLIALDQLRKKHCSKPVGSSDSPN